MAILRPRTIGLRTDHEVLFLERYRRLLGSALQLTEGDRERAEDLLHDAFIQFTLSRPDVTQIENLEAYLYGMLRKLHLSQMRRDARRRIHPHFLVEYDSAETGLHMIDPRDRLQAQEELRHVCDYACSRKETSKAGSVLILRFFHGYYPSEITKVMRSTRRAVDLRLRTARAEAKATLANPEALIFMNERSQTAVKQAPLTQSAIGFLTELRRVIFRSRQGPCLSPEQFDSIYEVSSEVSVDCRTLAHIASCPSCLDRVNKANGLPLLSERYAVDTMGKDDSSGGDGPGEGSGGGIDDKEAVRYRRRAREVFEHRPQELHISVNGFIQGSQTVTSEQSEQTLDIDMAEQIGFVEIFSEQETRLLFLDVDPPPSGAVEQKALVELSNERTLELTVSFRGPWPTLHTIYNDPVFNAELESATELGTESAALESKPQSDTAKTTKRSWRLMIASALSKFGKASFWLRPGVVTAIVAIVLATAVLSLYLRLQPPAVTSANLLERSTQAEDAIASKPDTVLHRTIQLEERSASGDLITRNHIEVWQSVERGVVVRRLYNEKNVLLAGDWRREDGVQTLYQHGFRPQLQLAPAERGISAAIAFETVWQQSVSAKDFTSLIGGADRGRVEESTDTYVIRYASATGQTNAPGLIRAALTIRRNDLHPIEQTLIVSNGTELREYHLVETSFERRAASAVEPSVFEPEPELVSESKIKDGGGGPKSEKSDSSSLPAASMSVAASTELEVEVLRLLHQANADLGEQVTVTRNQEGQLLVDGLVDKDQRKTQILESLQSVRNNPAVRIRISTIAETMSRQSKSKARPESVIVAPQDDSNSAQTTDSDLRRYFSARGLSSEQVDREVRQLANSAVSRSAQVMVHAWAIKRLGERFSAEQLHTLTPEARAKWLAIVRAHAQSVRQETSALRQELQPVFPSASASTGEEKTEISRDADLLRAIERLFEVCASNDRMVGSAFAIKASGPGMSDLQGSQFWRSLRRAEYLAARIESSQ